MASCDVELTPVKEKSEAEGASTSRYALVWLIIRLKSASLLCVIETAHVISHAEPEEPGRDEDVPTRTR